MALAIALVLGGIGTGCGNDPQEDAAPMQGDPRAFAGREVHEFKAISEVVQNVDAIVLGTVETIEPDRPDGPPGEEIHYTVATVRIDELWVDRNAPPEGSIVAVETLKQQPYATDWHSPGERVLLALTEMEGDGAGRYNPTSTQFVFIARGEDLVSTQDDPFAQAVAEMSLSEVRSRVKRRS